MPLVKWRKNGSTLDTESDHHRINSHGDLYMFNIKKDDQGTYECVAENEVGSAFVSMKLTVSGDCYFISYDFFFNNICQC